MAQPPSPSGRSLAGIGVILMMIGFLAVFVASLARMVGQWPVLVQALYYLGVGIIWVIPLKPLIRWTLTGSFRVRR